MVALICTIVLSCFISILGYRPKNPSVSFQEYLDQKHALETQLLELIDEYRKCTVPNKQRKLVKKIALVHMELSGLTHK